MTSAQSSSIDVSKLGEEDRIFYERYGRLPGRKDAVKHALRGGGKHYFDSGDYALSRAGAVNPKDLGTMHPSPERIPHSIPAALKKPGPGGIATNSPVKESSLSQTANVAINSEASSLTTSPLSANISSPETAKSNQ